MLNDGTKDQAAQQLAARRKTGPGTCIVCGTEFVGLVGRQYCSQRCRSLKHYRENHDEIEERRRERRELQRQIKRPLPESTGSKFVG